MYRPMVETKVEKTRTAQKLDCRDMEFTDRSNKRIACRLDYLDADCNIDTSPAGLHYADTACDKLSVLAFGQVVQNQPGDYPESLSSEHWLAAFLPTPLPPLRDLGNRLFLFFFFFH